MWRSNAFLRFLLKGVKHVNHTGEANGVNGPVGASVEVLYDFKDITAAEPFQGLYRLCLAGALCRVKGMADTSFHLIGKAFQFPPAWTYEKALLNGVLNRLHSPVMVILP